MNSSMLDTKKLSELVKKSEANGVIVDEVIGDKAFSSKDNIDYCEEKNIKLCKYAGLRGLKLQIYFTAFVANVKRIVKLNEMVTA